MDTYIFTGSTIGIDLPLSFVIFDNPSWEIGAAFAIGGGLIGFALANIINKSKGSKRIKKIGEFIAGLITIWLSIRFFNKNVLVAGIVFSLLGIWITLESLGIMEKINKLKVKF